MSFRRSASGISNYNVIHNVDYIVYSEGGNAELLKVDPQKYIYSIDSEFWGALFERLGSPVRVRIKSLGAKNNVLPYAKDITSGAVANCIAVLDKDHDDHKGIMIEHPLVVYTNGYSWENDAWSAASLIKVLSQKHPERRLSSEATENILRRYGEFEAIIRRLVFVDILCSCQDIECIPNKFGSVVSVHNGAEPSVAKDAFLKIIKAAKGTRKSPLRYHGRRKIYPLIDCYGKLFAEFAYGVFAHHYKNITGKASITRDHADQLMAASLGQADSDQESTEIFAHYKEKIISALNYLANQKVA